MNYIKKKKFRLTHGVLCPEYVTSGHWPRALCAYTLDDMYQPGVLRYQDVQRVLGTDLMRGGERQWLEMARY